MTKPNREYFMALFARRRLAIRIPKAKIPDAVTACREWWLVSAPTVAEARALCALWPLKAQAGAAKILSHGRNREV